MGQKERYTLLKAIARDRRKKHSKTAEQYFACSYKRAHLVCLAENRLFCLSYLSDEDKFSNPPYDAAADEMLSGLRAEGASPKTLEEARRRLSAGQLRPDWKRSRSSLDGKIRQAGSVREKNYWICMKRVGIIHAKSRLSE